MVSIDIQISVIISSGLVRTKIYIKYKNDTEECAADWRILTGIEFPMMTNYNREMNKI